MRGREPLVVEDVAPAHQRAEAHAVRADLDLLQARQFPQIDQQRRLGDAKRHHRHQALAAGQGLRLAAVIGEQRDGFIDGGWAGVFERRKFHGVLRPSTLVCDLRLWNDDRLLSPPQRGPSTHGPCNCGMVWQHAAARRACGLWRMRMALELSLSVCDYDRTAALFDGRAPIEGCDVTAVAHGRPRSRSTARSSTRSSTSPKSR